MKDPRTSPYVPSADALVAYHAGDSGPLEKELAAERRAVAAATNAAEEDITITIAEAAGRAHIEALRWACADPDMRAKLVKLGAIHPEERPHHEVRALGATDFGVSTSPRQMWVWLGSPELLAPLESAAKTFHVTLRPAVVSGTVVEDARACDSYAQSWAMIDSLKDAGHSVVDVDSNGRPRMTPGVGGFFSDPS